MKSRILVLLLLVMTAQLSPAQQMKLFNDDIRQVARPQRVMVMDFMEKYFYALLKKNQQDMLTQMDDDKVYFRKGKPEDMRRVTTDMPVSISLTDNFYIVSWTKNGDPFITIVFPAQFDLIFGMSQEKAQKQLKEVICNVQPQTLVPTPPYDLVEREKGVFVSQNSYFELESLNDASYYQHTDDDYTPIFNAEHKDYSAANLLQGLIPTDGYRLYIDQSIYGTKNATYTITFSQWLDYCAWMGLKTYFAVEEEREDGLLAFVLVHSTDFNFNHVLSVVIPDDFTTNPQAVLKAKLNTYIPTHNIKDLYQKENKKRKRIQWR